MVQQTALASTLVITSMVTLHTQATGIPVIDAANLVYQTLDAVENVSQTANQIIDLKNQADQYINLLKNTENAKKFVWDEAKTTITSLISKVDSIEHFAAMAGDLNTHLAKFGDVSKYQILCLTGDCSKEQREMAKESSSSQKYTYDQMYRGIQTQQEQLVEDATKLEQIQAAAESAEGRMEALQYANQLASNQAAQLMQIRTLLSMQANVLTARNQALNTQESITQASDEKARSGAFSPSTNKAYSIK